MKCPTTITSIVLLGILASMTAHSNGAAIPNTQLSSSPLDSRYSSQSSDMAVRTLKEWATRAKSKAKSKLGKNKAPETSAPADGTNMTPETSNPPFHVDVDEGTQTTPSKEHSEHSLDTMVDDNNKLKVPGSDTAHVSDAEIKTRPKSGSISSVSVKTGRPSSQHSNPQLPGSEGGLGRKPSSASNRQSFTHQVAKAGAMGLPSGAGVNMRS